MKNRQLVTAFAVTLHVSAAAVVCGQAAPAIPISAPVEIQTPQIIEALRLVRSYTELGLSQEFVVREDTRFDGVVLAVDTLTFTPGSRLILGRGSGDRTDRFIIARKLRVLHGEPRGIVTWDREAPLDIELPVDPRAPAGSMGPTDGADGAAGADGNTGNEGYPGRSAPTLYLLVDEMEGSPLLVDLRGQNGGRGGKGQPGGEGGMGRNGRSAVSSIIDCRSGGGDGGSGGRGGNGGKGGTGGRGGNGGTLILVAPEERLGSLRERILASVQQGMGGQGGNGGEPGPGGDPGLGGSGEGFCNGGRPGVRGANGLPGSNGDRGADGAPGIFALTPLTAEQARVVSLRE